MKSDQFLKEGFIEDAHDVHLDHEVQMAREECYHSAENAIALHKLLRSVSEQQGIEGWVSSKITLANDYLKTVREYLEYELMTRSPEHDAETVSLSLPIAESASDEDMYLNKLRELAATNSPDLHDAVREFVSIYGYRPDLRTTRTAEKTRHRESNLKYVIILPNGNEFTDRSTGKPIVFNSVTHVMNTIRKLSKLPFNAGKTFTYSPLVQMPSKGTGDKEGVAEGQISETSAGSVATVVNPTPKNKAKVGTLFGGTYKQPKRK